MNPPSKEQCAYVAGFLEEFGGSKWKRQAMEDVAKHLRSLHDPCPTCGGRGRVPCPEMGRGAHGLCRATENCPPDSDDNCTIPCPDCGDGGEG